MRGSELFLLLSLHVPSHYEICKLEGCLFHATVAFSPCYLSPRVDDSASMCFPSSLVDDWSWSSRARRTRMRARFIMRQIHTYMRDLVAWAA